MRSGMTRLAALATVLICGIVSCNVTNEGSWTRRVQPKESLAADVKSMQIFDFESQAKHDGDAGPGEAVADPCLGATVGTQLAERIRQTERFKLMAGDTDLKKFLQSRDEMTALINDGTMKTEVRDKLQKISGADAILVGSVSVTTKEHTTIIRPYGGVSIPLRTMSASATVNFRVYSLRTAQNLNSRSVTKSKTGLGLKTANEEIMKLVTQCVDDFCLYSLMGGKEACKWKMFADDKEPELKDIVQTFACGGAIEIVRERLESYAKTHGDSANALFDMAVLEYISGNDPTAEKLYQEAISRPCSDKSALWKAWQEMKGEKRECESGNSSQALRKAAKIALTVAGGF